MNNIAYSNFEYIVEEVQYRLLNFGRHHTVGEWQSFTEGELPHYSTFEVEDISLQLTQVPTTKARLQEMIEPNLPWAEDHFQERVSGMPLNPGEEYKNWPWYEQGVEDHMIDGKFSHTYMERYWPYPPYWTGLRG